MSFAVLDEEIVSLEGSHVFDIREFGMEPPKIMMLKVYPDVVGHREDRGGEALMHELGLCEDILDAVQRRAGDRPVARVRVRVGRLHHVHRTRSSSPSRSLRRGSVAEDATAELVIVPIRGHCPDCGSELRGRRARAVLSRTAGRSGSSRRAATS